MTTPKENPSPFTDEEMQAAAQGEQAAADQATATHMSNRVILLRANLNKALARIAELEAEIAAGPKRPTDRRQPSKAAANRAKATAAANAT